MSLMDAIDAVPEDFPGEPKRGERISLLTDLTDDQLNKLLYLVQEEGLARGWPTWWWE